MTNAVDNPSLTALPPRQEEAQWTSFPQSTAGPEFLPRKRKRECLSAGSQELWNERELDNPVFQLQQAIFGSPFESQSQNKQQTHCNPSCNSSSSGQPAATHKSQHDTMTASAFGHDDPLMPELLSWISCAAVLGGLAGSVAVTTCCKAIRQAAGCAPAPSLQQSGSDSDAEFDEQLAMYEEDTQPGQALDKVIDGAASSGHGAEGCLLPGLRRRNSGKRNLHKPWTEVEEAELLRLAAPSADYRKQVLSFSRLTKGGWAKIAHHLGRSGPSAVQNITSKYRTLKKQAGKLTDASSNALLGQAQQGPADDIPLLQSPFSGDAADAAGAAAPATAIVRSPSSKGSSKRHKLTACALAIIGLQQLPQAQGTAKQIMAAVEADSALAQHLNWAGDQTGKIKWRSGVTCALSAEKSGIFKKTGRKHAGQIVWHLDAFKAKAELQRYWIADSEDHDQAQS